MKNFIKKTAAAVLAAAALSCLVCADSFTKVKISLSEGRHIRWIDRMQLPGFAVDVYSALEEGSDNDGENDFLIEDKYYKDRKGNIREFLSGSPETGDILCLKNQTAMYIKKPKGTGIDEIRAYIYAAYTAFMYDHPEVFWLRDDFSPVVAQKNYGGAYHIFWLLEYSEPENKTDVRDEGYAEEEIKNSIYEMDTTIQYALSAMRGKKSDAAKITYFNDFLTSRNHYNTMRTGGNLYPSCAYKGITALEGNCGEKGPVCLGYSKAFKILCDRAGIPCVIANDYNHAWNNVKVGNTWYAADVMMNDPAGSEPGDTCASGYETHEYLLTGSAVTDRFGMAFSSTHREKNYLNLPKWVSLGNGPEISETAYKGR